MKKLSCKTIQTSFAVWLTCSSFGVDAAPNPASQDWVMSYVNQYLSQYASQNAPQGTYTSNSWISACPTGASGLLTGCLISGNYAGLSYIKTLLSPMWSGINTAPNSTANSVYIRKFPPGYTLSANSGQSLTYDTMGIPSTSTAICTTDAISESGMDIDDDIQNNPTSITGQGAVYNVSASANYIVSGTTYTSEILRYAPGVGGALPLGIPFYIVCIGINNTTGAPASIAGISVS